MFNDLTIISCSYNTPVITEVMLKSFIKVHGSGPFNVLISENSTNEQTSKILDDAKVRYIRSPGCTHAVGVENLISKCKTKYAILVDTDIVFKANILPLLDVMEKNDLTLIGEICGSRGGYNLHPRVHPWFCIINVDNIKTHNIKFNDMERVHSTNSSGFYNNIPINSVSPGNHTPMYDVGATFYEDILANNLGIANIPNLSKWFAHYEGSSWQRVSGHSGFKQLGNKVWQQYQKEIQEHKDIDIYNKFNRKPGKKFAFFYPVFAPDSLRLKETISSLQSWLKNIDQAEVDIVIGGWCVEQLYWSVLDCAAGVKLCNFDVKKFDKNYGKAHVINDLTKTYLASNPDCEYFLSCDSDIIMPDSQAIPTCTGASIFRRMEDAAIELTYRNSPGYGKPFAYFALDQQGECFHEHEKFDKTLKVARETIVWNSNIEGIAGGAIFVSTKFWKLVGGYRIMGVYSGDDGYLLYDSFRHGHLASVIKTISVFHPNNSSESYSAWKETQRKNCNGQPINNLETAIEAANNFWRDNEVTE